ncbi:hypothetical protein [Bradyrhizobium neotropicale]|uniref:hypothetical protein n=1 Tax=Bradyrhizobium neotropicale TaxID=1497615 RepID=UPI001AD629B5|nr:hypothetical protein [Bradyrhizobium neotropicale]MBO4228386.1 hypothetical protein [Bradyrhizobium neotropicale]
MSIFPDSTTAGGLVVRDEAGNATNPPNVPSAYVPAPAFVSSCLITALPAERIEAKQINAIVSELLALAEGFDPDGPWDCNVLTNLRAAFAEWVDVHMGLYTTLAPPAEPQRAFWWDNETGVFYIYFENPVTGVSQWVQANGAIVDQATIIGTGIAGRPLSVGVVDCGSY